MLNHSHVAVRVADLAATWRAIAAELRRSAAAEGAARALERAAHDLEDALRREADETLSLQEAARVSGYSADHLARLVRQGKIPNAGRRNAPRVRRGDLPHKANALPRDGRAAISRAQIARSVVTSLRSTTNG